MTKRVGGNGQTKGIEVKRVEELLWWAYPKARTFKRPNGVWDKNSAKMMVLFQEDFAKIYPWTVEDFIDPDDSHGKLKWLAHKAGVVSWCPGYSRGKQAVLAFVDNLIKQAVPYGWTEDGVPIRGGTRMVRGWAGDPTLLVYTTVGTNAAKVHFTTDYAKTLNCTAFANVMLFVWMSGGCHVAPYSPGLAFGAMKPLGDRYGMPPLKGSISPDKSKGVFSDLDKLEAQLIPDKMYHFARYKEGFGIKHDMVLMNGVVYESNKRPGNESSVYSTPLRTKFKDMVSGKKKQYAQVLGPAPG